MRTIPLLTVVFAAACFGCSACSEERQVGAASSAEPATVTEIRGACTPGLAPAARGFAAITEIPSLGGNRVFVEDINDDGVAVGGEATADGTFHAFRHTDLAGVQDLGTLRGFGTQSFASAIASNGAIGGHSDRADGTGLLFGYGYTVNGGRTALCPGGCSVWDLNSHGQIVGLFPGKDPTTWQAFLYAPETGVRTLGTLGGGRSSASGISEIGLVVGNAQLASSPSGDIGHAFLYDARARQPELRDLNDVVKARDWVLQSANDVNDRYIVGYGLRGDDQRAFRLEIASGQVVGQVVDLGAFAGARNLVAWSVDIYGDVVGWGDGADGQSIAFVHAAGLGGMRKLDDLIDPALGWKLVQANGINNRGAIVGWGTLGGAARGFKITLPVCVAANH